jgi:hypothetical protein
VKRIVQPEWLDTLPPDDPRARRSRHDLRRVNRCMGHAHLMISALAQALPDRPPEKITELGAGDGNFLLSIAQRCALRWPAVKVTLLDLQNNVPAQTLAGFATLGWRPDMVVTDVFDWPLTAGAGGVVIANLFLHHFEDERLAGLLRLIAARAEVFIALEPRRAAGPLFFSRLLWGIGCNDVTRHDAVISVRAGFSGAELSALWPDQPQWRLTERRAGIFSHLFVAQKLTGP